MSEDITRDMPGARSGPCRVLVAVDGSLHSARAVQYLVRRMRLLRATEVHLVSVLPPRIADLLDAQQADALLQAGYETLRARCILDEAHVAYRFHAEVGDPATRITEVARASGCDEILMGSRGQTPFGSLALGSVAHGTVHRSPVPITVVPNPSAAAELDLEDDESVHRVLLCLDGSPAAYRAVDYVRKLRDAAIPVEIHLLNVQAPVASGHVRRFVSRDMIDAYHRAESEQVLSPVSRILREAGLEVTEHAAVGNAAETIACRALEHGCTRIVMGANGRNAFSDFVLGSTALHVLHTAEIPVTLVKGGSLPAGVVSAGFDRIAP